MSPLILLSLLACTGKSATDDSSPADDSDSGTGNPLDYDNTLGDRMRSVAAGVFTMGGGAGDPRSEYLDHVVTLTRGYWVGSTEVTRGQWSLDPENVAWAFSPGDCEGEDCPADNFAWYDAAKFANWLSVSEGLTQCYLPDGTDRLDPDPSSCAGYRFPTEAEWEFAARAGEDTVYSGGDVVDDVAWVISNADGRTHPACTTATPESALGTCDMSGNLGEWTSDWYDGPNTGYTEGDAQTDPPGPEAGTIRVMRGGAFEYDAIYATVTARGSFGPDRRVDFGGLRLCRTMPTEAE